jgi:hypothetical protein
MLSSSFDDTLRLWDMNHYTCVATIQEETHMNSLLKLPDGNIALVGWEIKIRDVNDGLNCIKSLSFEGYEHYDKLILLTDSRMAFSADKSEIWFIIITDIKNDYNILKIMDETEEFINPKLTWPNLLVSNSSFNFIITV